eukprot:14353773-Alexandrium_andersonii.AAC.1
MRTPENVFRPVSSAFANPCNSGRVSHDAMADSPVYILGDGRPLRRGAVGPARAVSKRAPCYRRR